MNCYGILFLCCLVVLFSALSSNDGNCCEGSEQAPTWEGSWKVYPTSSASWSVETRIPMTPDYQNHQDIPEARRGKFKVRRRFKKFLLPLLLAYKLKFFTLIPVLIGGLVLLTGATGLAGFFFALFAAVMGLKSGHY